jgi:hypothetical protein
LSNVDEGAPRGHFEPQFFSIAFHVRLLAPLSNLSLRLL